MDNLFDFMLERKWPALFCLILISAVSFGLVKMAFNLAELSKFQCAYIGLCTSSTVTWPVWTIVMNYYEENLTQKRFNEFRKR